MSESGERGSEEERKGVVARCFSSFHQLASGSTSSIKLHIQYQACLDGGGGGNESGEENGGGGESGDESGGGGEKVGGGKSGGGHESGGGGEYGG
ncbi:hypothetical protein M8J77_007698 [Diaphorina citri]|nr:hypothetical protein M8J77_007698 [Diaphorina citri]